MVFSSVCGGGIALDVQTLSHIPGGCQYKILQNVKICIEPVAGVW
jgi:hypothetical protein